MLASIIAVCEISYEIAKKRRKYKMIIAAEQERSERGYYANERNGEDPSQRRTLMRRPSKRNSVNFVIQQNDDGWALPGKTAALNHYQKVSPQPAGLGTVPRSPRIENLSSYQVEQMESSRQRFGEIFGFSLYGKQMGKFFGELFFFVLRCF